MTLLGGASPLERGLDLANVDDIIWEKVRDVLLKSFERIIKVLVDKKVEDIHHVELPVISFDGGYI